MRHDVTKEIQELASLTGKSEKELKSQYDLYCGDTTWETWNRRDEAKVKADLAQLKSKEKEEQIRKERMSGYRWTQEDGDWVVSGNFTNKKAGDEIIITKVSGQRQSKIIESFTPTGNAIVF